MLGKSLCGKGGQALKGAAQASGGVTVPGNVKKMCECGIWGQG